MTRSNKELVCERLEAAKRRHGLGDTPDREGESEAAKPNHSGKSDTVSHQDIQELRTLRKKRTPTSRTRPDQGLTKKSLREEEYIPAEPDDPRFPSRALPLEEYVQFAFDAAEFLSRGCEGDRWESDAWAFTRIVKSHPTLMGMSGPEAARTIAPYLYWEDLEGDYAHKDPDQDFIDSFEGCKVPAGFSPLSWAWEMARFNRRNWHIPAACVGSTLAADRRYVEVINLAAQLQRHKPGENIRFPHKLLGELFGVHRSNFTGPLRSAVEEEYLSVVRYSRYQDQLATEYRVDLYRFPESTDQAGPDGQGE